MDYNSLFIASMRAAIAFGVLFIFALMAFAVIEKSPVFAVLVAALAGLAYITQCLTTFAAMARVNGKPQAAVDLEEYAQGAWSITAGYGVALLVIAIVMAVN